MRKLLHLFTRNWQLKLLACALAVLLWVVVSAEQATSSWIPVPLEVHETDPNYQLLEGLVPPEVRVRFVGPGREFLDLAVRRPPLRLAISRVQGTEELFELRPDMVQLPNELDVSAQGVDPGALRLRFREMASRELPVRVEIGGGPGRGWTLVDSLRVRPSRIRVSGPTERMVGLQAISTVPIRLPAEDSLFTRVIAVDTVGLEGLELSARRVRVSGRVDRIVERQLPGLAVSVGPGVTIRPTRADLHLVGAKNLVEAIRPSDLRIVLAIDSIPEHVAPEGSPVPLRVEGLRPGVRGTLRPRAVILLPARLPVDSVVAPRGADADSLVGGDP